MGQYSPEFKQQWQRGAALRQYRAAVKEAITGIEDCVGEVYWVAKKHPKAKTAAFQRFINRHLMLMTASQLVVNKRIPMMTDQGEYVWHLKRWRGFFGGKLKLSDRYIAKNNNAITKLEATQHTMRVQGLEFFASVIAPHRWRLGRVAAQTTTNARRKREAYQRARASL